MNFVFHFVHAWLMFTGPMKIFNHPYSPREQWTFTMAYGMCVFLFRYIYRFFPLPFGTHMLCLIFVNIFLLTVIVKNMTWLQATYITLIMFLLLMINDALVFIPLVKYFGMTINYVEEHTIPALFFSGLAGNFSLIVVYLMGKRMTIGKKNDIDLE